MRQFYQPGRGGCSSARPHTRVGRVGELKHQPRPFPVSGRVSGDLLERGSIRIIYCKQRWWGMWGVRAPGQGIAKGELRPRGTLAGRGRKREQGPAPFGAK